MGIVDEIGTPIARPAEDLRIHPGSLLNLDSDCRIKLGENEDPAGDERTEPVGPELEDSEPRIEGGVANRRPAWLVAEET